MPASVALGRLTNEVKFNEGRECVAADELLCSAGEPAAEPALLAARDSCRAAVVRYSCVCVPRYRTADSHSGPMMKWSMCTCVSYTQCRYELSGKATSMAYRRLRSAVVLA